MTRIGVYGWGIVAPRSPDIQTFAKNLESAESWMSPFHGFGPDTFLVGKPEFDFGVVRPWIDARFKPNRFPQLQEKMDEPTKFAVGAFLQSLEQNPGLEQELSNLGTATHVYVGSGLGNIPTLHDASLALHRAQRRWDRFWAQPELNDALKTYLDNGRDETLAAEAPPDPEGLPEEHQEEGEAAWRAFWAGRSPQLHKYLEELAEIESIAVEGDVEAGKMSVLKEKRRRFSRLQRKWGAPEPPWTQGSANFIWNIQNTPASQISLLGQIRGRAFSPAAACSTFGVAIKLGVDAIRRGEAKAVVVGATDPAPHPLVVGAFYAARVISADGAVSKPLGELRGTHVAGGSVIWVLGDADHMEARGFQPLGLEVVGVGATSDADHIITPSKEGPMEAIRQALTDGGVDPAEVGSWDLHATATPGDYQEVSNLRELVPEEVLITARKGTFGHGMAAGGGWEMTAQFLGYDRGELYPTPLSGGELNGEIAKVHRRFVLDRGCAVPAGAAGKLSMGVGGINACVLSRPWS